MVSGEDPMQTKPLIVGRNRMIGSLLAGGIRQSNARNFVLVFSSLLSDEAQPLELGNCDQNLNSVYLEVVSHLVLLGILNKVIFEDVSCFSVVHMCFEGQCFAVSRKSSAYCCCFPDVCLPTSCHECHLPQSAPLVYSE